jgi:hypothetical protein
MKKGKANEDAEIELYESSRGNLFFQIQNAGTK